MAALASSRVSLNRIFDGVGRPFFGWLSDQIGREYTMALAFLIGAAALFTLSQIGGTNPVVFVLVTALYFGVYGEIFSLFPATQGDTFGSKYAAANAGMLYTAKGTGALLVPIAAAIAKAHGYGRDVHALRDLQHHRGAARAVRAQAHAGAALRRRSRDRRADGAASVRPRQRLGMDDHHVRRRGTRAAGKQIHEAGGNHGNRKSRCRRSPRPTTAEDTLQRKSRDAGVVSGGHLVAKALKNEGVDTIFTLCGGHIIDIYDGCVDEGIRIIDVRHEQVAAHAADGYARQTGKLGCVVTTAGPGLHQRGDRHRHRVPLREPGAAHRRPGRAHAAQDGLAAGPAARRHDDADHQVRRHACRAPSAWPT